MLSRRSQQGQVRWEVFFAIKRTYPLPRPKLSLPDARLKPYGGCEASSEERSAGNPHATICGSWRRVTASGDPVGGETQFGCAPCSYLTCNLSLAP